MLPAIIAGLVSSFTLLSCGDNSESEADYPVVEIPATLSEAVKRYNEVREFHNGIAIVQQSGRYGFIDSLGNEIVPCEYIGLSYNAPGFYTTYVSNHRHLSKQGLIGPDGKRLTPDKFQKIEYIPDLQLICCYDVSPKQFFNLNGEEVNSGLYNKAAIRKAENHGEFYKSTPFYNGLAMATYYDRPSESYYQKMIDSDGNIIMSITEKNGKYGVVDTDGNEVVPHQYQAIDDYDSGYLLVSDGVHRQGLWDLKAGKETVKPVYNVYGNFGKEYDLVHTFLKDGLLRVRHSDGVQSLINPSDGKVIIGEEADAAGFDMLPNGFIRVAYNGDFSFIYAIYDIEGNEIIGKYDYIYDAPQGFVARRWEERDGDRQSKEGAFNLRGKKIVDVDNYTCKQPSEGLIPVQHEKSGKFGYVNMKGKYVIEPKYDDAGYFSEGLAPVEIDGHWGYVNRIGADTFNNNSND